ncbi:two-component sensor histidine kinase [Streptomyces griseocarneus]|nr:two-component sensor histidine kinase [Streptomyces griseocarneus]
MIQSLPHPLQQLLRPHEPILGHAKRRWARRVPYFLAVVFTAILAPTTGTVLGKDYGLDSDLAAVLGVCQLALLLAVRRTLLAWFVVFTADVVAAVAYLGAPQRAGLQWPWTPMAAIGLLVLFVALAMRERPRTLVAVWGVTGAAALVLQSFSHERATPVWVAVQVVGAVLMLIVFTLRSRGDARRALAEQETISEAERARRTLLEERARIARELHDVVAHHMSMITVQADSAPYRISGMPPEAAEEFGSIATAARESLTEMRRLLGVLRSEENGEDGGGRRSGELAPQPGVTRIPQLVESTLRSGLPVELTVGPEVDAARLPQAVDLSAYRIVQEALANVVRHAPGAATRVSLSADRTGLTVLVVNDPVAGPATPLESSGTGHGLVGMRERVRLVGGSLDTGPLPEGGYRVAARLPFAEGPDSGSRITNPSDPSDPSDPSERESPTA